MLFGSSKLNKDLQTMCRSLNIELYLPRVVSMSSIKQFYFLLIVFFVFLSVNAFAGTSVDGFFPEDYVRSGELSARRDIPSANIPAVSNNNNNQEFFKQRSVVSYWQKPQAVPPRMRAFPGRFVRNASGVRPSSLTRNEWQAETEMYSVDNY
jgi:hypothetical protein